MYLSQNTGLRLIDLIDEFADYDTLYTVVKKHLHDLITVYPVESELLFDDFIQRLCDNFYSRNLSFDTYLEFKIKLKFLLENNRKKYQRIIEIDNIEIDPLIDFNEKEIIKDDTTTANDSIQNGSEKYESNSAGSAETKEHIDEKVTTQNDAHNSHVQAFSDTPQSNVNVEQLINNKVYVSNATQNKDEIDDHTEQKNDGDNSSTSTNESSNEASTTRDETKYDSGKMEKNIERTKSGYNENRLYLLEKYRDFINDVNNEIIKDIDEAHLFSSIYM